MSILPKFRLGKKKEPIKIYMTPPATKEEVVDLQHRIKQLEQRPQPKPSARDLLRQRLEQRKQSIMNRRKRR